MQQWENKTAVNLTKKHDASSASTQSIIAFQYKKPTIGNHQNCWFDYRTNFSLCQQFFLFHFSCHAIADAVGNPYDNAVVEIFWRSQEWCRVCTPQSYG
ncbi:MAG: hypothetical protein ABF904_05355 [Ethanoligenens sp.]